MQKVLTHKRLTEFQKSHDDAYLRFLKQKFVNCPIRNTLGVLGKKWSLLIVWHIGVYRKDRFNRLLEVLPGIAPGVLSIRLKQLEQADLIVAVEKRKTYPMIVRWALTEKGLDVIPTIMMIVAYGSKYNSELLYGDKKVRKLPDIFNDEGMELMRRYF